MRHFLGKTMFSFNINQRLGSKKKTGSLRREPAFSALVEFYCQKYYLQLPMTGLGSSLSSLLLKVLADYRFMGLVTVILAAYSMLLPHLAGISVSSKLPLVVRQRGGRRSRSAVPPIPSASLLRPSMTPVITPVGCRISPPPAKVCRRMPVVANGNTQDELRHNQWVHKPPGAVVPGTRVPVIVLVDPVHAIVKEIVGINLWCIVDRIAWHRNEFREQRQVDSDVHAG